MRRSAAVALLCLGLFLCGPTGAAFACHKPGHQDTPGQACTAVPESPLSGLIYPLGGMLALTFFVLQQRRRVALQRADD
jgi:hypothetical protein